MTDHTKKLEEAERDLGIITEFAYRMGLHEFGYLPEQVILSRVRELEAALNETRDDYKRAVEAIRAVQAECDRLRAILDAPVTEEEVEKAKHDLFTYGIGINDTNHAKTALDSFLAARRSK
jgi:hypothetical protein